MANNIIGFNNDAFTYTGIWQSDNGKSIISHGTSATLSFDFCGLCVKILLETETDDKVIFYLDGSEISPEKSEDNSYIIKGDNKKHTVKIITVRHCSVKFFGLETDKNTEILRSENNFYIQFIGDSITDAYPGFSTTAANVLGVDYSIVSYCGMSLVDGWGWYALPENTEKRIGMESYYFKFGDVKIPESMGEYTFEYFRIPDMLVMFLGTNDYILNDNSEENGNLEIFAQRYLGFIDKIFEKFSPKPILLLNDINKNEHFTKAMNKVFEMTSKKYKNVYLLDFEEKTETAPNDVHPTSDGYKNLSEILADKIADIRKIW